MKLVTVVGARPQFVKAAMVTRALGRTTGVREVLVHTGQHYDDNLSEVFFREMGLRAPDVNLGVGSGSHGVQTGRMLEAIEGLLLDERPDRVLVYGDTNSTMAAALAAIKLHVPVAHVEAGVRMRDLAIPEEVNRLVTDQVSDLLLCPTRAAVENLRSEGFGEGRIHLVGDVMYDAALLFAQAAQRRDTLQGLGLVPRGYLLATVHRAEDTDHPARLRAIFDAFVKIARQLPVVVPLHPRTRAALHREGMLPAVQAALRLIEPVGYLDMALLEKHARLVVTDSGGVQKEAFFHRVPCVVLMRVSPWPELIELGWNRVVEPLREADVLRAIEEALQAGPGREDSPYGDGHAAEAIVQVLKAGTRM